MKIYMAGPLFTVAERQWNRELAFELSLLGHEVFLPQENEGNVGPFNAKGIYLGDVKGSDWSEAVVAWLEGPDPDSGTCWEHGYAVASGKFVVGYTTDLRHQGASDGPYDLNLMMVQSSSVMVRCHYDDGAFPVAEKIHAALQSFVKP